MCNDYQAVYQATRDELAQDYDLMVVPAIERAVIAWLNDNYDIVAAAVRDAVENAFIRGAPVQAAVADGIEAAMANFLTRNDQVLTAIRDGTRR